jgi:hypothetical protein
LSPEEWRTRNAPRRVFQADKTLADSRGASYKAIKVFGLAEPGEKRAA